MFSISYVKSRINRLYRISSIALVQLPSLLFSTIGQAAQKASHMSHTNQAKMPRERSASTTARMQMVSNIKITISSRVYSDTSPGQPIRLISTPMGPSGGGRARNPFDTAIKPSRPLEERITVPNNRSRSLTPIRHTDVSGPAPPNVDRYVPGQGSRSHSPRPRRREGRPPGARRGDREPRGGRGRDGGGRPERRPKKTQEELDAEMEDYWGGGAAQNGNDAPATAVAEIVADAVGDIEMAE
jgi:hypothetical protein